jgi:hypothetical protein
MGWSVWLTSILRGSWFYRAWRSSPDLPGKILQQAYHPKVPKTYCPLPWRSIFTAG